MMITHLKLRLAASALTLAAVLHPSLAHCQPAAPAAATVLPHISVSVIGQGAPVILIPGLSSPRATWDGIAPHLAAGHRVYLVQVNGFGGDAPGDNLEAGMLDGIVADLHGYIAANRLRGAAVIGHSMGGLLGLMLAKAHPGDVGRLMVVDSLPFIGTLFSPDATVAAVEPRAKMMRDQIVAAYGKPANPAIGQATASRLAAKPESQAKVAAWAAAADPRVTGEALYEDMTTDLRGDIAGIVTPITLVYPYPAGVPGETVDSVYHGAYKDARRITYVPVTDSAHFVMLDQPAAFQAAVDAFLK